MIGLGKWEAPISTMLFSGTGRMTITDLNGFYHFDFELVGHTLPEITVTEIKEEGNTLSGLGECDMTGGKQLPFSLEFSGDTFSGKIKVPLMGTIKLSGYRI